MSMKIKSICKIVIINCYICQISSNDILYQFIYGMDMLRTYLFDHEKGLERIRKYEVERNMNLQNTLDTQKLMKGFYKCECKVCANKLRKSILNDLYIGRSAFVSKQCNQCWKCILNNVLKKYRNPQN